MPAQQLARNTKLNTNSRIALASLRLGGFRRLSLGTRSPAMD